MSYFICILDFEATCWGDGRSVEDNEREIIEFPSILYKIDWKNNVEYISEFAKYVRPVKHPILSEFCTKLTGITQDTVDNAEVFETVYNQHYQWINDNVQQGSKLIFLTCGMWDLRDMLPIELKRYNLEQHYCYTKYLDVKSEFAKCFGQKCGGMVNMLKKLKIELTGQHHSGIDDCRNLAKIVIEMINNGYKFK